MGSTGRTHTSNALRALAGLFFLLGCVPLLEAGVPNPAAAYAEKLGYTYRSVKTPQGEQGVVEVAAGVALDAWAFYRGEVGSEYAYGAQYGYRTEAVTESVNGYQRTYAVCVEETKLADGSETVVAKRVPMLELMERNGEPLFEDVALGVVDDKQLAESLEESAYADADQKHELSDSLPSSFDWRDYNGRSYIGAVRDQGGCGSCYAFGACAAAEGAYNVATESYDGNCADFSEAFIAFCLGRLSSYTNHFFGCDGADYEYAELEALTVEGVCDESDFPYVESPPASCDHWDDPRTVMSSWSRIDCGDINAIKTAIMTHGVVDAAVLVEGDFESYSSGVYDDANTTCGASPCYYSAVNHAIALVGWDDSPPEGGGGCWILRNSWGSSWGESGYMRIRYTAARVACEACYFTYEGAGASVNAHDDTFEMFMNETLNVGGIGVLSNDTPSGSLVANMVSDVGHGTLSLDGDGSFSYEPDADWSGTDSFMYSASDGSSSDTATVNVVVSLPSTNVLEEDFEDAFVSGAPQGWSREYASGSTDWARSIVDQYDTSAHGGMYHAMLFLGDWWSHSTYLVTPELDFSGHTVNPNLEFWHMQRDWSGDQDELRVYYKTSAGGSWNLLATYTTNTPTWTKRSIPLPNVNSTYYIGFLGEANWGYGLCIDDVIVSGGAAAASVNPVGGNSSVTTSEDTPYGFESADFPFSDGDGHTFAGIRITSEETAGDLEYGGFDVVENAECPSIASLSFTPLADASGSPYAAFGFRVKDSSGAYSDSAYTMTVNVTPVNDPPLVSISTPADGATACEGTNLAVQCAASDVDGSVVSVAVYTASGQVGADETAPYAIVWSDLPIGSHVLWAQATDDDGASATTTFVDLDVLADYDRDGTADVDDSDDDNDGLPDTWEDEYGLSVTNADDAVVDSDGDGQDNVEEFIAGTGPDDDTDCFTASGGRAHAASPEGVIGWQTVTGRLYTLYMSDDFIAGAWTNVDGWVDVPGSGEAMSFTNSGMDHQDRYYRVKVRMDD